MDWFFKNKMINFSEKYHKVENTVDCGRAFIDKHYNKILTNN
jgi:hypothetical protein